MGGLTNKERELIREAFVGDNRKLVAEMMFSDQNDEISLTLKVTDLFSTMPYVTFGGITLPNINGLTDGVKQIIDNRRNSGCLNGCCSYGPSSPTATVLSALQMYGL